MKKILLFVFLAFVALPLIAADPSVKTEGEKKEAAKSQDEITKAFESYSWDNKKFSVGIEAFNGIGTYGGISLLQVNTRMWLMPNFQISLHGSVNINRDQLQYFCPVLLNAGYGKSNKNVYWFVEGGIGRDNPLSPFSNEHFILNTSTGIEWLVSKDYAFGVNVKLALLLGKYETYALLNLSITANLVL